MATTKHRTRASSQSNATADAEKKKGSAVNCGQCNIQLKDQVDISILCDTCEKWFHLKCVELQKDEAEFISRLEAKGVRWDCKNCRGVSICPSRSKPTQQSAQLNRIEKNIDQIKSMVSNELGPKFEAMQKTYAMAVKDLERNSTVLASAAQKSIKQTEQDQKEIRERNMIIFGVEEGSTKQDTIEKVQKLMQDCHLTTKVGKENLFRLGKMENVKTNDHGEKVPRPLKMCTESKEQKWDILKRINGLKLKGIFAKPDLNKEEREADFRLRAELKKIRENNPLDTYKIFRNQIKKINQ